MKTKILLIILAVSALLSSFYLWGTNHSKSEKIILLNETVKTKNDSIDILNEQLLYWKFDRIQAFAIPEKETINENDTIRVDIGIIASQTDSYDNSLGGIKVKVGEKFDTIHQALIGEFIELKGDDGKFSYTKRQDKKGKFQAEGIIEVPLNEKTITKLPFRFEYEVK